MVLSKSSIILLLFISAVAFTIAPLADIQVSQGKFIAYLYKKSVNSSGFCAQSIAVFTIEAKSHTFLSVIHSFNNFFIVIVDANHLLYQFSNSFSSFCNVSIFDCISIFFAVSVVCDNCLLYQAICCLYQSE